MNIFGRLKEIILGSKKEILVEGYDLSNPYYSHSSSGMGFPNISVTVHAANLSVRGKINGVSVSKKYFIDNGNSLHDLEEDLKRIKTNLDGLVGNTVYRKMRGQTFPKSVLFHQDFFEKYLFVLGTGIYGGE